MGAPSEEAEASPSDAVRRGVAPCLRHAYFIIIVECGSVLRSSTFVNLAFRIKRVFP